MKCLFIFTVLPFAFVSCSEVVPMQMSPENWQETLKGEWIIKFYAPWCPACRAMEEEFKRFAVFANTLGIKVAEVDITKQSGLSGRFIVTALPTLYHSKDGEFRRYSGKRTADTLQDYIERKYWKKESPVASYRHPNSYLMGLMAGLFQMSVWMKDFLELLTEKHGFSEITAYVIFAMAIIIVGLTLGVAIIIVIDCIWPPKMNKQQPKSDLGKMPEKESAAADKGDTLTPDKPNVEEKSEDESANDSHEEDEPPESQRSIASNSSQSEFENLTPEDFEDAGEPGNENLRQRKKHTDNEEK